MTITTHEKAMVHGVLVWPWVCWYAAATLAEAKPYLAAPLGGSWQGLIGTGQLYECSAMSKSNLAARRALQSSLALPRLDRSA